MGKASAKKRTGKVHGEAAGDKDHPLKAAAQAVKSAGRTWYLLLGALLLLTIACYANSLNNTFVFDDALVIAENPGIRGIENIPRLLGFTTGRTSYRPIRMVSYALDYTLNKNLWCHIGNCRGADPGLYPPGYHIGNIAYHLLTALLVFLVVSRLAGNFRVALLAAGIFALHPVHTDSVTYLAGRRDILFTLFYLAGFYFFLRYRQEKRLSLMIFAFIMYMLSMGSKEMGVTLPALFLCYDVVENFPPQDIGPGGCARRLFKSLKKSVAQSAYLYVPLFIGALAFSYYKVFVASPSYQKAYYGDSVLITFLTVVKILAHYLQLLIYPVNLIADYSYNAFPLATSLFEPAVLFSLLFLAGVIYALLRLLDGHKLLAFGGAWFFLTLLPVCHIFPHHELLAEHYLYLPSVGFCLLAAVLCDSFMREGKYRFPIAACVCLILAFFALRTIDRNGDWKNSLTLYEKTVKTVPECARANSNLCEVYTNEGRLDEALSACKQALAIKPDQIEANHNLGTVYARQGMVEEAIASYKQALVLRPRYAKAYFNIGVLLYQKRDLEGAVDAYKQALSISPYYAEVRNNLGMAYSAMGRFQEAIEQYKWALAIKPNYTGARTSLAAVYLQQGAFDDAIAELEKTVAADPDYAEVYFNLGYAYSQKGDSDKAVGAYKRALAKGLVRADVHSNLGNLYLQEGRLDDAVSEYLQAISLQENFAGAHNNLAMAYFKKQEYALAIKHCDRAGELGISNPALLRDLLPYR
jgi:tetratricopeptide (TPR) repeat protein